MHMFITKSELWDCDGKMKIGKPLERVGAMGAKAGFEKKVVDLL